MEFLDGVWFFWLSCELLYIFHILALFQMYGVSVSSPIQQDVFLLSDKFFHGAEVSEFAIPFVFASSSVANIIISLNPWY